MVVDMVDPLNLRFQCTIYQQDHLLAGNLLQGGDDKIQDILVLIFIQVEGGGYSLKKFQFSIPYFDPVGYVFHHLHDHIDLLLLFQLLIDLFTNGQDPDSGE